MKLPSPQTTFTYKIKYIIISTLILLGGIILLLTIFNFVITYFAPLIPFIDLIFTFLEKISKKKEKDLQFIINEMSGDVNITNNHNIVAEQQKLEKHKRKAETSQRNKQWFQKYSHSMLMIILIISFVFYFIKSFFPVASATPESILNLSSNPLMNALYFSLVMSSRNFLFINIAIAVASIIRNLFISRISIPKNIISIVYYSAVLYLNILILNSAYIDNDFKNFNLNLANSDIQNFFSQQTPISIIIFFFITLVPCSLLIHNYFETKKVSTDITTSAPIIAKYFFIFVSLFLGAWYFSPNSLPFPYLTSYLKELIEQIKQPS